MIEALEKIRREAALRAAIPMTDDLVRQLAEAAGEDVWRHCSAAGCECGLIWSRLGDGTVGQVITDAGDGESWTAERLKAHRLLIEHAPEMARALAQAWSGRKAMHRRAQRAEAWLKVAADAVAGRGTKWDQRTVSAMRNAERMTEGHNMTLRVALHSLAGDGALPDLPPGPSEELLEEIEALSRALADVCDGALEVDRERNELRKKLQAMHRRAQAAESRAVTAERRLADLRGCVVGFLNTGWRYGRATCEAMARRVERDWRAPQP